MNQNSLDIAEKQIASSCAWIAYAEILRFLFWNMAGIIASDHHVSIYSFIHYMIYKYMIKKINKKKNGSEKSTLF